MASLVAHRGQRATYPENTLESIQQAIDCGARAVEFDVQMTADHIPVLSHDAIIPDSVGNKLDIREKHYHEISDICVGEVSRLGDRFLSVTLPSLRNMVDMLTASPQVQVFVELKEESFQVFGVEKFVDAVIREVGPIQEQCVIISENLKALLTVNERSTLPTGWIIVHWHENSLQQATDKPLDYLVVNCRRYHDWQHDFSGDPWKWFMYETSDADEARMMFEKGIEFVETDDICRLLRSLPEYQ